MSSNIPVRRVVRTRAAARDTENETARTTRPTTRARTVAAAAGATTTTRKPVFSRPPSSATATKAKSTGPENTVPTAAVKPRRGALVEVTKRVTNKDAKSNATIASKGKGKETAAAPEKPKQVLVDTQKTQDTKATRATTRRTTRSTVAVGSTSRRPITAQASKKPLPEAPIKNPVHGKSLLQNVKERQPSAQTSLVRGSSTLQKRSSNLTEQAEAPRDSKRLHTEQEQVVPLQPVHDDSQEEVEVVAVDLMQQDPEPEPESQEPKWRDLDADDWEDPLMASEYVHQICDYWKRVEAGSLPDPEFLKRQPCVTWQHRAILISWLMEINIRFRLLQETLFLSVNILDRLLSIRVVSLQKLQLVGVACLLIACKYEETFSPSVTEMVQLCDGQFKAEELVRAEQYVLKAIDWNLSFPGPMGWLRRGSKADDYEEKARTISKYFLEIGTLDKHLISTPPSLMAAASLWLARLILGREEWTPTLAHYTTYDEHELIPTANHMLNFVLQPTLFPTVYKKYASKRFLKCSIYLKNWARQRWSEGTKVELEKHVEWLKADVRAMRERQAVETGDANMEC